MSTRLRRTLIALALFLMLIPFVALGGMGGMGRVRMGSVPPSLVEGQEQYRGAVYCQTCHQ